MYSRSSIEADESDEFNRKALSVLIDANLPRTFPNFQ